MLVYAHDQYFFPELLWYALLNISYECIHTHTIQIERLFLDNF